MAGRLRMQTEAERDWVRETGKRLRKARVSQGYGQSEFAEMIECSNADLSNFENGRKSMPLYPFVRACVILGKCMNSVSGRKGRIVKKKAPN